MTYDKDATLQAKVNAVNAANAYAMELYPVLHAIFAPYVSQKVLKQTGELLEKINKQMPELPCRYDLHVYRYHSHYSLCWTIKASCSAGEYSNVYHEATIYIGNLQDGCILTKLTDPPELKTDYKFEEIKKLQEEYARLKKIADEVKDKLYPFGE